MKTITTSILCAALILLPVQRSQAIVAQCGIAVLIVAVVGTAVYVIYKCEENSDDKCSNCKESVPKDSTSCPNCGTAARCEDCNTTLPEDADECPTCGTAVPEPSPVMNSLQMSSGDGSWTTVVPPGSQKFSRVKVKSFSSQREFDDWVSTHPTPLTVTKLQNSQTHAIFRLSGQ